MTEPGMLGYAVAGIAFAMLAILAMVSDRGFRQGRALLVAACASVAWATALAVLESSGSLPPLLLTLAEGVRYLCWVWLLYLVLAPAWSYFIIWSISIVVGGWFALGGLFLEPNRVLTIGGLASALLGLVMLEQTVRNTRPGPRRDMRFLLLGIGGLFSFDLFLYSQAELLHGIDRTSWQLRGVVNAALVPLLAMGARRLPQAGLDFAVSRQVTFYTTALIAVGIYALLVAGAGVLLERVGGQWSDFLQLVLLGGAVAVLVVLVGSVTIRRQLRVFLSKHFYRSKYDYRMEWLKFIRTLSSATAKDVPAAAVRSVAQILASPGGMLFRKLEGAADFLPVGHWTGDDSRLSDNQTLAADSPLISFIRARRWIVDLREYEQQPDLYDHAPLPDWLAADPRWRLLCPIFFGDALIGLLLLIEPPPPFRLTYEDRDLLNMAGQHVATLLAQQDADQRVAELSQFEAYNRLTTFVMHDLKNCAAQLSLLVGNATRHRNNPDFVNDAFSTIERTAERMMRLVGQLRSQVEVPASRETVDLRDALRNALGRCATQKPRPRFEPGPLRELVLKGGLEQLTAALEHVIRNAQEAAGELGEVAITVEDNVTHVRVCVRDTGAGMDTAFIRNRLFRPFDTTKGPTGMGIGAFQAREFVRSIGGAVEVHSEPGRGTVFRMDLPLVPP